MKTLRTEWCSNLPESHSYRVVALELGDHVCLLLECSTHCLSAKNHKAWSLPSRSLFNRVFNPVSDTCCFLAQYASLVHVCVRAHVHTCVWLNSGSCNSCLHSFVYTKKNFNNIFCEVLDQSYFQRSSQFLLPLYLLGIRRLQSDLVTTENMLVVLPFSLVDFGFYGSQCIFWHLSRLALA